MKFSVHPKVTLEEVAGQYLLIAYGKAQLELPYIQQINETGAYFWRLLEDGKSYKEMLETASEEFVLDKEEIAPGINLFLESLSDKGYIIPIV